MNILVIGSGGREHALAWKLDQSPRVNQIYVAPGNAGTAQDYINVEIDVMDFEGLIHFSKEKKIDLAVIGPEDPLSEGIIDQFEKVGIKAFGPDKESALFEKSKDFTKQFLTRYQIPTAKHFTTSNYDEAVEFIETLAYPAVIKADGLCQGKGVVIVDNLEEAEQSLQEILVEKRFGSEGDKVVIEEFLEGIEQSQLCFVSNNKVIPMETAQDYKKIYDGDEGPNTGGMGAISPSPIIGDELKASIDSTLKKIEEGLEQDGFNFSGILFIGFMIQGNEAKVLEFNVRFGDPETEALLPRLESDLVEVLEKTIDGTLAEKDLKWTEKVSVGVVLYSQGYPKNYEKHVPIDYIPEDLNEDQVIFHNGTIFNEDKQLVTNGGRVLTPVVLKDTLEEARTEVYHLVKQIKGTSLNYRTDIGKFIE